MLFIVFMLRVFRAHFSPVKCLKPFSAIGPNPWLNIGRVSGLNIFIHISIYSNIQIYILQYNHDGIQKKVMRLIRICFPLNIKVHSLKL